MQKKFVVTLHDITLQIPNVFLTLVDVFTICPIHNGFKWG